MGNPSTSVTAAIAILSAIAGGLVTGLFTLLGLWREHAHVQRIDQIRRSRDASKRVLDSNVALDRAITGTLLKPTLEVRVIIASNEFAQTLAIESIDIQSDALRDRLQAHMRLANAILGRIGGSGAPLDAAADLELNALQVHALMVNRSIAAHVNRQPLPPYASFDITNSNELLDWASTAEQPPR